MAAVASGNMAEPSISPSQSMGRSSSARLSEVVNSYDLSTADIPDRPSSLDRSSSSSRQSDDQNVLYLKSEEYRQLFRLPPDEFLIQDFNCALQENFLLQGHMYLFGHYICFYSNLFGFETKKIIPFKEITSVRRAKAAAIFPTAIEIIAGGKKYFFTSFLSRDEAFKIINDGWLQQSDGVKSIVEQQDSVAALNFQGNENSVLEQGESSRQSEADLDTIERHVDPSLAEDIKDLVDGQLEMLSTSTEPQVTMEDAKIVQGMECSPSGNCFVWEPENCNGPSVPECYTMVAESKFPVKVKEFFGFCFSDDAVDFEDLFHRKCGDKGFSCSKWRPDEKVGQIRNASFQHPIKMYLGAKFGSCNLVQKYRIYRHSHLVVESIQEITDVPYGDYFRVEVLWDVKADGELKMGCVVRVYVYVNFCKKTMFRGTIVQSSVDECRDVYGTWIGLVHELLKQKSVEIQEGCAHVPSNPIANNQICAERKDIVVGHIETLKIPTDLSEPQTSQNSVDTNQHLANPLRGGFSSATAAVASFRDSMIKFCSILKGQSQTSLFLVISIALILLLMQVSILVLLSRPQQIHVISQADCMSPVNRDVNGRGLEIAFIEKRMKNLKEEMYMTESLLEKMKLELEELELLRGEQRQFRTRHNL